MESIIYDDSPLADYLEGQGEAGFEWTSTKPELSRNTGDTSSFAPRGIPTVYTEFRRKLPSALKLDVPPANGVVSRFQTTCSHALVSGLGRNDNAHFLEQFRYTIIASQLLNERTNSVYNAVNAVREPTSGSGDPEETHQFRYTLTGICCTAGVAFATAWSAHMARGFARSYSSNLASYMLYLILAIIFSALFIILRLQWLLHIRNDAISAASSLVTNAQSFDATASTAITLIQEVELVSRGYRISSPLPPISRIEDQSQTRRCARLRRNLHASINSLLLPHAEAYKSLRPLAIEIDLEKYHDIYEITQTDIQEIEALVASDLGPEPDDPEHLKSLRLGLQRLHTIQKLFLCSLLALDADSSRPDSQRWTLATSTMQSLSSLCTTAATTLDKILTEEARFSRPATPKLPLTPNRERMRAQIRKVGTLSHGIRALQAKMHILREELDRTLDATDEVSELGNNLLAQYDSIGADLRELMQEWEDGRAALATNIDRNERRISLSSTGMLLSRATTPSSLGGLTAVGGSPTDALKILNGETLSGGEGPSTSSDEEVFEAIALPRQKSTLTREERLAKMKEERVRAALRKEEKNASGSMLKELESVIKLRPRGRTTGRLASVS